MVLIEIRTVVFELFVSPLKVIGLAFHYRYLNVKKAILFTCDILRSLHISIHVHNEFTEWIVIVVKSIIVHIKKKVKSLLAVFKH